MNIAQRDNKDIPKLVKDNITIPKSDELKIIEWRFNQFLGEKLIDEEMCQEDSTSYLISEMQMTNNGEYVILGDRGGRIIIFKKCESSKNKNSQKLTYFYEFGAYDKDFDVHRSTEYSEMIRGMAIYPMKHKDIIDILSIGYRTIKFHRVYYSKIKQFNSDSKENESKLNIPKLKSFKLNTSVKEKFEIKLASSNELNSISYNHNFLNNVITSDDTKVLLWDIEASDKTFCVVDMEQDRPETAFSEDNPEKITTSRYCQDPHLFSVGTSYGNIFVFDTRQSSCCMKNSTVLLDEFQNITNAGFNLTKTLFSSQIMSVHDLNFNLYNDYTFASRHALSVNIWDQRNPKAPLNKFLVFEPVIPKLSYMYLKNYLALDKFSMSTDKSGKYILTGGYNNMFHIFDIGQRLNTQITVDESNEKIMNTNIIRKINSKGSCFYKKDDSSYNNINFENIIHKHCYSKIENYICLAVQNCVYTYNGNMLIKENKKT